MTTIEPAVIGKPFKTCFCLAADIRTSVRCNSCPLSQSFLDRLGSFLEESENEQSSQDSLTSAFERLVDGLLKFLPSPELDQVLEQLDAYDLTDYLRNLVGKAEFLLEERIHSEILHAL